MVINAKTWNNLPKEFVDAGKLNLSKHLLDDHWKNDEVKFNHVLITPADLKPENCISLIIIIITLVGLTRVERTSSSSITNSWASDWLLHASDCLADRHSFSWLFFEFIAPKNNPQCLHIRFLMTSPLLTAGLE